MLPGLSFVHLTVIAIVALLVLGPDKLPDLARRAGHTYQELQRLRAHLHLDLDDLLTGGDSVVASDATNSVASDLQRQSNARRAGPAGGSAGEGRAQARRMPARQRSPTPAPQELTGDVTTTLPRTLPSSVQPGRRRQHAPANPTWSPAPHDRQDRVTAGPLA